MFPDSNLEQNQVFRHFINSHSGRTEIDCKLTSKFFIFKTKSAEKKSRETALDKGVFNVVIEEDENIDNFGADADPEPLSKPVI